uniref:Uncharacterized protein n=1 Tax=Syphacia muris TaxID=451379 RepID=A0A0N5AQY1_9BILA
MMNELQKQQKPQLYVHLEVLLVPPAAASAAAAALSFVAVIDAIIATTNLGSSSFRSFESFHNAKTPTKLRMDSA